MAQLVNAGEYNENKVLDIPRIENGQTEIGSLWNCHSSKFVNSLNLFVAEPGAKQRFTKDHIEALPTKYSEYTLNSARSSEEKRNSFHIAAEISIELMNGDFKIAGGVSFDQSSASEFHSEELLCLYKIYTYLIRTKPKIAELIDPDIKRRILSGELQATHYIESVQLGGSVAASLKYQKVLSDSLFDLKGFLEGALTINVGVPVTIGLKLSLAWLDKEGSSSYSKNILVESIPKLSLVTPTTTKMMFRQIESIDEYLLGTPYDEQLFDPKVVFGVPISFKLAPISQLFSIEQSPIYQQLSEAFIDDYLAMLLKLNDYKGPNFVTSSLYTMYNPLAILFGNVMNTEASEPGLSPSINPFVSAILDYESPFQEAASALQKRGLKKMDQYKKDKDKIEELVAVLQEYDAQFNELQIQAKLRVFYREGRLLLISARAQDVDPTTPIYYLKSEQQLADWLRLDFMSNKLLLSTAVPETPTADIFSKLFTLSSLGVENLVVAIAYPNICADSSLTLKYGAEEAVVYANTDDMSFVLDLLLVMTSLSPMPTQTIQSPMKTLFYRAVSEYRSYGLQLDLKGFHKKFFEPLRVDGIHRVKVCESFIQLLLALTESKDRWNFVIPIQGLDSAYQQISAYFKMCRFLEGAGRNLAHEWIVGYFNKAGAFTSTPLLFAFYGDQLRAICLDYLDLLILQHQLVSTAAAATATNFDDLLSYRNVRHKCLYSVQGSNGLAMIEHLSHEQNERMLTPIEDLPSFKSPQKEALELELARSLIRSVCGNDLLGVLNCLTSASLPTSPQLVVLLPKHVRKCWSVDAGWFALMHELAGWSSLHEDLDKMAVEKKEVIALAVPILENISNAQDLTLNELKLSLTPITDQTADTDNFELLFLGQQLTLTLKSCPEDDEDEFQKCLAGIIRLLTIYVADSGLQDLNLLTTCIGTVIDFLASANPDVLNGAFADICSAYVGRLADPELTEVHTALSMFDFFRALSLLSKHQYSAQLMKLQDSISAATESSQLENLTQMREMIEWMHLAGFTGEQTEDIWRNPKWAFWMSLGSESDALIKTIILLLCDGRIPRWLPSPILRRIVLVYILERDEDEDDAGTGLEEAFTDLTQLTKYLERIFTKRRLPRKFNAMLQGLNEDLKQDIQSAESLFYWNAREQLFDEPWSLDTIAKAIPLLRRAQSEFTTAIDIDNGPKMIHAKLGIHKLVMATKSITRFVELSRKYPEWQAVSGGKLTFMEANGRLSPVHGEPWIEFSSLQSAAAQIFPYILQQLRLGDWTKLNELITLINYPWNPSFGARPGQVDVNMGPRSRAARVQEACPVQNSEFHLGREDFWTALLSSSDGLTLHHALQQQLSLSKMALPLLVRDITANSAHAFKCVLGSLKDHNDGDRVRVILTIRHYNAESQGLPGKSSVLNTTLMSHPNTFCSQTEHGRFAGPSIASIHKGGYVEFIQLTQQTTNPAFWNRLQSVRGSTVLLVNVHGDLLSQRLPLQFLVEALGSPSIVVFWKVQTWQQLKERHKILTRDILVHAVPSKQIHHIVLDPNDELKLQVGEDNSINVRELGSVETLAAVQKLFENCVLGCHESLVHGWKEDEYPLIEFLRPVKEGSADVLGFIEQHSVRTVRRIVELYKRQGKSGIHEQDGIIWEKLLELLNIFLENTATDDKYGPWVHLCQQLNVLSNGATRTLQARIQALESDSQLQHGSCNSIQTELQQLYLDVDHNTLTFDQLFSPVQSTDMFQQLYSAYFNRALGPIQLKSDNEFLSTQLLGHCLKHFQPQSSVFVLSVIGLKIFGKFKLFNQLLGHGFYEGPCIPSLWIRCFHFPSPEHKFDMLLVIDADGFGFAVESPIKQRQLVTFLVGVSHLALFCPGKCHETDEEDEFLIDYWANVENMLEMPLVMLKTQVDLRIKPNIALLLPDSVSYDTIAVAVNEKMQKLLNRVREFSEEYKLEIGISSSAHDSPEQLIQDRIHQNTLVLQTESLPELYSHILESGSDVIAGQSRLSLTDWHIDSQDFWTHILLAQQQQPNLLQFQNISQFQQGQDFDSHFAAIRHGIDTVYSDHEEVLYASFEVELERLKENQSEGELETPESDWDLSDLILDNTALKHVLVRCVNGPERSQCASCLKLVLLNEAVLLAVSTGKTSRQQLCLVEDIKAYMDGVQDYLWARFAQMCRAIEILEGQSKRMDGVLRAIWDGLDDVEDEHEKKEIAWFSYRQVVSTYNTVPSPQRLIETEIMTEYASIPWILDQLPITNESKPSALGEMDAFEIDVNVPESPFHGNQTTKLTWSQLKWFQAQLEDLPKNMLTSQGFNIYQIGMIRTLKIRLTDEIVKKVEADWNVQLKRSFVWALHLSLLVRFQLLIVKYFTQWDGDYNALTQLDRKKEIFPNLFSKITE